MWALLIISMVQGEMKYTHFNTYDNESSCHINRAVLESTFEDGEGAVCMKDYHIDA